MNNKKYREFLINAILEKNKEYSKSTLIEMSFKKLEKIYEDIFGIRKSNGLIISLYELETFLFYLQDKVENRYKKETEWAINKFLSGRQKKAFRGNGVMKEILNMKFDAVLNDGLDVDVDMSKICGCTNKTMNWCEENCKKYYSCDNIAIANDLLKEYEEKGV